MRTSVRRTWIAVVVAITCLISALPGHAQEQTSGKVDALVDLINHARASAGMRPLARSSELDAAAHAHSVDMVEHDYLDHTGSDGSEPQDRADRAGYHVPPNSGWIVVEVISAISADPSGPVNWWLNDQQHHNVLMNPRWREIGAGYAQGGEYGNYWTALFGCRPGMVPTVTLDGVTYNHVEECGDPSVASTVESTPTPTVTPATPTPTVTPPTLPPTSTPPRQDVPLPNYGQPASGGQANLVVSPQVAERGAVVNVRWAGIASPTPTDWVGLYRSGDGDAHYIGWLYVGCAQVPLDARALGSCNLQLPSTVAAGTYEFRLFGSNGYARLGVPLAVSVK